MAQNFITTNGKFLVWHDYTKGTKTQKPPETVYNETPESENDMWISEEIYKGDLSSKSVEYLHSFVAKLYRSRNWTTYQVSYCKDEIKKQGKQVVEEKLAENELIETGKRVYSVPTIQIMKPLPTARKCLGYIRPMNAYTQLTTYQTEISKPGYDILLTNYLKSLQNP